MLAGHLLSFARPRIEAVASKRFISFSSSSSLSASSLTTTTHTGPFRNTAPRLTRRTPDVPDTRCPDWCYSPRWGHTIHASEIDSKLSRIHGLVKSMEGTVERVERYVESCGVGSVAATRVHARQSLYGRAGKISNAGAGTDSNAATNVNADGVVSMAGNAGKTRGFSTGKKIEAAAGVDAAVLPSDCMLRGDEVLARLEVIGRDVLEVLERMREAEARLMGARTKS